MNQDAVIVLVFIVPAEGKGRGGVQELTGNPTEYSRILGICLDDKSTLDDAACSC